MPATSPQGPAAPSLQHGRRRWQLNAAGGTIISGLHLSIQLPGCAATPKQAPPFFRLVSMSYRSGISALIFLVAAGVPLLLMAELGADVLFVSHNCGSEFNYYGCETPLGQAARVAQKSSS